MKIVRSEGYFEIFENETQVAKVKDKVVIESASYYTSELLKNEKKFLCEKNNINQTLSTQSNPLGFTPPHFGVTVLGNSHGFDSAGSTSGYILWINQRGVMLDPPPFSS